MKKLFAILVLLIVAVMSFGQTVYYGASHVIRWDASTQYDNETAYPAGSEVYYEWFVVLETATRSEPASVEVGNITANTQRTISPVDGERYAVGVRTVLYLDGVNYELSATVWSDQAGTPTPWVIQVEEPPPVVLIPSMPGNLRRSDY